MRRILSLVLALVMCLGAIGLVAQPAAATPTDESATATPPAEEPVSTDMTVSDELIALLKFEEGFCRYPIWDYSQWTVGYGTRCPSDKLAEYQKNGITDAQAEALLRNHLTNTEYLINYYLIKKYDLTMTQGQFDALVMFSYNMGGGWITSPSQKIHKAVVSGATDNTFVDALSSWCRAGGQVKAFLMRRRLSESYMYQEGLYAHTPPEYYCYVTYDGNGGSISQSAQGYNTNMPATPSSVATHDDYTFAGWFTSPTGGEKVESLKAGHNKMTLYAHWEGMKYEEPELFDEAVKITVTTNDVNLRKGPGTNYAITGTAHTGDTFDIWQVQQGGDYLWGYYKAGWICLQYTNYDKVISGENTDEPEETEPEVTEPEETEPEATQPEQEEPEVTQPQPTEPEETEPEVTEPEATQPAKKVMGTVTNGFLKVRQGPGTGYATVDTLPSGTRVEILEQKSGGAMVWGRISSGWISMSYVVLDGQSETTPDTDPGTTVGQVGTVNCEQLNVRDGAGITYKIVASYYKNDKVTITEKKTVGATTWGKTAKGWVSMDYISMGNSGDSNIQGSAPTQVTGTVTGTDDLRIRKGPGVTYSVAGFLSPGAKVTILEQKTVDSVKWGRIANGWISLDYVTLSSQSGGNSTPDQGTTSSQNTGTVKSELRIRSEASTSGDVVGFLAAGAKITILEKKTVGTTVWGRISNGWISLDFVSLDGSADAIPDKNQNAGTRTVTAACLCVRSAAGTGNATVGYLYKGAKVTVTEIKTVAGEQWGKIPTGWICLTYTA